MQGRLIVFDAGSTKTMVLATDPENCAKLASQNVVEHELVGFNPNRPNVEFYSELETLNLTQNDEVFFYGSGLGSPERKQALKNYFLTNFKLEIAVFDDLLGAARAALGINSGVISIMGTGGIVAYYNGKEIIDRCGGYGYLIDDLGGGYELGKRIITAWLNNSFSNTIDTALTTYLKCDKQNFVSAYYSHENWSIANNGLGIIAGAAKIISDFKEDKIVADLLISYFDEFIKRHVQPIITKHSCDLIYLTGSIAEAFEGVIKKALAAQGISVKTITKYPVFDLFKYHKNQILMESYNQEKE